MFEEEVRKALQAVINHYCELVDGIKRTPKLNDAQALAAILEAYDKASQGQFVEGWQAAIKDAVGHMQRSDLDHGLAYDWLCAQLTPPKGDE